MGALCFVTLFGVVGAKPLPLGEPRVLIRSVKTHTGLLLTKVTKLCIMDSIEREVFLWVEYQCHKVKVASSITDENMRR